MDVFSSVDIDTKDDIVIASLFYKYLKNKNEKISKDFLIKYIRNIQMN